MKFVTHHYFGDVPAEEEDRMTEMIPKCYEIVDENFAVDGPPGDPDHIPESILVNRVKDISFRLRDHMFFDMPQGAVQRTFETQICGVSIFCMI
jgi:hypothetical protein